MSDSTLFVDVGGTTTRVWTKGFKKIFPTDLAKLPSKLKKIVVPARLLAGTTILIIGLRGVWTAAEKKMWKRKLRGIAPKITVLSDIELAHRLAFGGKLGIVLNAGTGSIALGRDKRGKIARAGGLGPLVGDEGSAFWIGREYLRQRGGRGTSVVKIAALAKKVLRAKDTKIIDAAQTHLRQLVADVRKKLNLPASTPVHLTGGLFENAFFKRRWKRFRSRA